MLTENHSCVVEMELYHDSKKVSLVEKKNIKLSSSKILFLFTNSYNYL